MSEKSGGGMDLPLLLWRTGVDELTIQLTDEPAPRVREAVEHGLDAYNRQHGVEYDGRLLSVALRDPAGGILGGLIGFTHWGWLYVELLWVDERVRGEGWGSKLLAAAEQEAKVRGCSHSQLDTLDIQALPFYQKLGYAVWGVLDDYPPGHKRYYVKKDLV